MSIRCYCLKITALSILAMATLPMPVQQAFAAAAAPRTAAVSTSVILTVTTPSTISYGESVDGYSTVSSSDGNALSGTVTFYEDTLNICTLSVTQTSSCPPDAGTGFVAGSHMLTAVYSGDATHLGATSNGVPVVVLPDVTTISLSSSANPATGGQRITFTASVTGDHATPSGQVQLLDGSRLIATATLNSSGVTAIPITGLSKGTHPITAVYAATQDFAAATSAVVNQVIQAAGPEATVTTLASNANPAAAGQSVTFTAKVTATGQGPVPGGTVTFLDGSTQLGAAALNSAGVASLSTALLAAGSHAISASYGGNATAAASTSSALTETVAASSATGQNPFSLTVAGSPMVTIGSAVNLLVTVAPRQGSLQPVKLSCAKLPDESACTFGTATLPANGGTTSLQISTMAPHSCETATASLRDSNGSLGGPVLAGLLLLLLPFRRRRPLKGLLLLAIAACGMATLSGCGNCTDLGTRPGDYTIQVIGTATGAASSTVVNKVVLHVVVPQGG